MSGDNDHRDQTLAKYRPYLIVLAETAPASAVAQEA